MEDSKLNYRALDFKNLKQTPKQVKIAHGPKKRQHINSDALREAANGYLRRRQSCLCA